MDMIEKLKKNEKPFGLLSKEEQECLKDVEVINLEHFQDGKWEQSFALLDHLTYRINPDYQSEPEHEDVEIEIEDNRLGIDSTKWFDKELHFTPLHEIIDMPNFVDFLDLDEAIAEVALKYVSTRVRLKHKVIARFVKE